MSNDTQQLRSRLEEFARNYPNAVRRYISKGDVIPRELMVEYVLNYHYFIDDAQIFTKFGDLRTEGFLEAIALGFSPLNEKDKFTQDAYFDLHAKFCSDDGKIVVPFSEAVNFGIGECLERALTYHLAAQSKYDSYFLSSYIFIEPNGPMAHSFNITFTRQDIPFLIDVSMPWLLKKDGNLPYTLMRTDFNMNFHGDCIELLTNSDTFNKSRKYLIEGKNIESPVIIKPNPSN